MTQGGIIKFKIVKRIERFLYFLQCRNKYEFFVHDIFILKLLFAFVSSFLKIPGSDLYKVVVS